MRGQNRRAGGRQVVLLGHVPEKKATPEISHPTSSESDCEETRASSRGGRLVARVGRLGRRWLLFCRGSRVRSGLLVVRARGCFVCVGRLVVLVVVQMREFEHARINRIARIDSGVDRAV